MQITASLEMNAPATAVWQVLGEDFADISKWLDSVLESTLDSELAVGTTRTCTFEKDLVIKEQITRFDQKAHKLTYAIRSGLPSFMGEVDNAWTIEDIGNNRSRATSQVTVNPAWYVIPMTPLLKMSFRKTLRGALSQLSKAAEAA